MDRDGENHRPILLRRLRRHHHRHDNHLVDRVGCPGIPQSGASVIAVSDSAHRMSAPMDTCDVEKQTREYCILV